MNFPIKEKIKNEQETKRLAEKFSDHIKPDDKIVLNGELGSGKTFFIRKVLFKFGITNVNSPSFSIVNEYYGKFKIYHFDFFRIKKIEELYEIGWQDYMNDNTSVIFIEWGDLFPKVLPPKRKEIKIAVTNTDSREFEFINYV